MQWIKWGLTERFEHEIQLMETGKHSWFSEGVMGWWTGGVFIVSWT